MATFTKLALQPAGTTGDGLGISVVATATAGTAIHTASATATTIDELWLYAYNDHSATVNLTIEWGSTASGQNFKSGIVHQSGLLLVCAGLIIQGNATPKVVRAFAGTASVITLYGYVNRITV